MNELKLLNEDVAHLNKLLSEEKLTPEDIKVLFSHLSSDEVNKQGVFTKIKNLTNKITSSNGYTSLKLKLSKTPAMAVNIKKNIEDMYQTLLPQVKGMQSDLYHKLSKIYNMRHQVENMPYVYSLLSLITKNFKNGNTDTAKAILMTADEDVKKSAFDDSVDIINNKNITPENKEKLETLYDMAYGNEVNEKYLNTFFSALANENDRKLNLYINKWFDHVKNRLKKSYSVHESVIFENRFKRFGQKLGLIDKEKFDYSSLISSWKNMGYPDDTEEIYDMLYNLGFSKRDIQKSFKRIGVDISDTIDPNIVNLAKFIKKNKIEDQVVNYLDKFHKPKTLLGKRKYYVPEQMQVINKTVISSLFEDIANQQKINTVDKSYLDAIFKLASQLKLVTDKHDKMFLIHDILEYLKDNKDKRDFSNIIGSMATLFANQKDIVPVNYIKAALDSLRDLNETISAGCISESEYSLVSYLAECANVDISELNCSLIYESNSYKYDLTLIDSDVSINSIMQKLQESNTYGRIKKCS